MTTLHCVGNDVAFSFAIVPFLLEETIDENTRKIEDAK